MTKIELLKQKLGEADDEIARLKLRLLISKITYLLRDQVTVSESLAKPKAQ